MTTNENTQIRGFLTPQDKATFFQRYTDRSFILTLVTLGIIVWLINKNHPIESTIGLVVTITPFILGEKFKDVKETAAKSATTRQAIMALSETSKEVKSPETEEVSISVDAKTTPATKRRSRREIEEPEGDPLFS